MSGAISANAFASGNNQNAGNFMTDYPTTKVVAPPGGHTSISFGDGSSQFDSGFAPKPKSSYPVTRAPQNALPQDDSDNFNSSRTYNRAAQLRHNYSSDIFNAKPESQPINVRNVNNESTMPNRSGIAHRQNHANDLGVQNQMRGSHEQMNPLPQQSYPSEQTRFNGNSDPYGAPGYGGSTSQNGERGAAMRGGSQQHGGLPEQGGSFQPREENFHQGGQSAFHQPRVYVDYQEQAYQRRLNNETPAVIGTRNPGAPVSANAYANGSNQNCGNMLTDKPTTRVVAPPGGFSSFSLG